MRRFAMFLVVVSLLVACSNSQVASPNVPVLPVTSANPQVTAPDAPANSDVPIASERVVPPAIVIPPPQKPDVPADLKTLLAKRSSAKSLMYDYKTSDEARMYRFSIKGSKAKVKPAGQETLSEENNFFTTAYLDLAVRSAVGYCDEYGLCKEMAKGPFVVSFDRWYRKTPFDWARELEDGMYLPITKQPGERLVNNRGATTYTHVDGELTWNYHIDKFYGLPMEIEAMKETPEGSKRVKLFLFDSPAFNTLSDKDMKVPSAT